MSWLKRLKVGLSKTSTTLTSGIKKVLTHKKLDTALIEEFEEALIQADLGPELAAKFSNGLAKEKFGKDVSEFEIKQFLAGEITKVLATCSGQLTLKDGLNVILFCGVNGNGKTTTIGKLAAKYHQSGKKVIVAACDTFRAAAEDQLLAWVKKGEVDFIRGSEGQDPASIAYTAMEKAIANAYDVLLIDTAGRLQNKTNLMDELEKIIRVIKKLIGDLPFFSILVLDATTGTNALEQVRVFKEKVNIDGLIITKLDGTAKGGVAVSIVNKFNIPIYAIGVGERMEDLNEFNPRDFANSLVALSAD